MAPVEDRPERPGCWWQYGDNEPITLEQLERMDREAGSQLPTWACTPTLETTRGCYGQWFDPTLPPFPRPS